MNKNWENRLSASMEYLLVSLIKNPFLVLNARKQSDRLWNIGVEKSILSHTLSYIR